MSFEHRRHVKSLFHQHITDNGIASLEAVIAYMSLVRLSKKSYKDEEGTFFIYANMHVGFGQPTPLGTASELIG